MKTTLLVLAYTLVVYTDVLSGATVETKKAKADLPDRLYVSANSAFYGAAESDCESRGLKMGTLPLRSELPYLDRYMSDQLISKLWVGAKLKDDIPECGLPQSFNSSCWEWHGIGPARNITEDGVTWYFEGLGGKMQNSMSRAYYDLNLKKLKFQDNTRVERVLCENSDAPVKDNPTTTEASCGCSRSAINCRC